MSLPTSTKAWVLTQYLEGAMSEKEHFALRDFPLAPLQDGQVLVKVQTIGLEPAMRPSFSLEKSYREPTPLNTPLWAFGVGEVIASKSDKLQTGTLAYGLFSMSQYHIAGPETPFLMPVDPKIGKQVLSLFAPPGLAAHVGLFEIGELKKGDTVLVSGAAGATGSLVIQIAKRVGAKKIIGIASKRKLDAVRADGADEAVAYDDDDFEEQLKKATGEDVNLYFENVGGKVLDAALGCMAPFGRIAVCGMISSYGSIGGSRDSFEGIKNLRYVLTRRLKMQGYICSQVNDQAVPNAIKDLGAWAHDGSVKAGIYTHPDKGVEHCIKAFEGLLSGANTGKMTVDF